MIVLGLDTATPATAVALRLSDGSSIEARDDPQPGARPGHTAWLLALAARVLGDAGISWSALDRIVAGTGPGTFTGLRIGISTARALAQSLGAELCGVSSLRALAWHAPAPGDPVVAVIDARRGEAFLAAYRAAAELERGAPRRSAPHEVLAPCVASPEQLAPLLRHAGVVVGAEERWTAVGDGALRFRTLLEEAGASVPDGRSPVHRVSARAICELGAAGAALEAVDALVPEYLRRPDAELALEGAR
ncbi:MAG: tRNA (adenosine(37)-N6)-threonylcarbamoyltransferase complex dimerization subunit type 1 TsaB [Solirubrobacterales bacterium]|nr:tRNA (adenosine(37)-N6)-threonylcarbamoyltransferase complex dimerization subunit type 1 TsaB [Solirubrobacterales bacterium]